MQLPPCGLYRTLAALGSIPAGRLVYFHNHGDPGPGLYLPSGWTHNRVELQARGQTLSDPAWLHELEPLPPEGLYRVTEAFHCCERKCRAFEPELLVELGYNAEGKAILFQPELVSGMIAIPTTGIAIDHSTLAHLKQLKVPQAARDSAMH
ncbi:MAG TPA: hypothetical protein VHZ95_03320 [Polyangiales bacterium]|nr:hypothetical protein [Polyangiales bacterium]